MKYETVHRAALSWPHTTEQPHHHRTSFRVHGRIFATAPSERDYVHILLVGQEQTAALATPSESIELLCWGGKIVGVRVHLASAAASEVKLLLRQAYEQQAAKGAARQPPRPRTPKSS